MILGKHWRLVRSERLPILGEKSWLRKPRFRKPMSLDNPKHEILTALYVKANLRQKRVAAKELCKWPVLFVYRKNVDSLRRLLLHYYRQGLVSRERVKGAYCYALTPKGIDRMEYFEEKELR